MSGLENQVRSEPIGGVRRLATRVFFDVYQRTHGLPIGRLLKELNASQYWSPARLADNRTEGLRRHLAYAFNHSPYWHETLKTAGYAGDVEPLSFLRRLPIMDKQVYRREQNRMIVPGFRGRRMEESSSGSTGEPTRFPLDAALYARIKANLFRKWSWAGYQLGEPWVWLKTDVHSRLGLIARDAAFNCTYHSVTTFNHAALKALLGKLAGHRFALLRSYPSALRLLAEVARAEGMDAVRTRNITTTGENLHPRDRHLIESTFRCRVFDTYGGDAFSIAGQCDHGAYHINDESVIVEIVDEDGNPLPAGQAGHVIVSDFHNRLMPMFRWRICDRARLGSGTCACGRGLTILESIEGRDSDVITLPNGAQLCMSFFDPIFENKPGVRQFQVIQNEPDRLRFRLVVEDGRYDACGTESYVRARLHDTGGGTVCAEFDYLSAIPRTRSGKERVIIACLSEERRRAHGQH